MDMFAVKISASSAVRRAICRSLTFIVGPMRFCVPGVASYQPALVLSGGAMSLALGPHDFVKYGSNAVCQLNPMSCIVTKESVKESDGLIAEVSAAQLPKLP